MSIGFYERPMVKRIIDIFDHPVRPTQVIQQQFDQAQDDLIRTAAKQWHEIGQEDYWHYLLDLCYVELQQDLFDYLFPAFLIRWWEGQLSRLGGPESECDFYRAIDRGDVFSKMMNESRRQQVYAWITDAYIEGVDAWSGNLSVDYNLEGPYDLHGPLCSFNALGQSVPVTKAILDRLANISTIGRAQWWLVFSTGIAWNDNEYTPIPESIPFDGGLDYVTDSAATIFDHGFLAENLDAFSAFIDYPRLLEMVEQSAFVLSSFPHSDWAKTVHEEVLAYPDKIAARLDRLKHLLSIPSLGGDLVEPLWPPD